MIKSLNNKLDEVNWQIIFFSLIFIGALGLRVHKFSQKETMYGDEFLSITLSAYLSHGASVLVDTGKDGLTGAEMKEKLFSDDSSISE